MKVNRKYNVGTYRLNSDIQKEAFWSGYSVGRRAGLEIAYMFCSDESIKEKIADELCTLD